MTDRDQVIHCEGFNFSAAEKAAIAELARKDPNGGIVSRLRGWDASSSPESTLSLMNLAADWIESHRKEILHNREYLEWQRLNKEEQADELARLRLTDAEREAVEEAADTADVAAEYFAFRDAARSAVESRHAATLRSLRERMGGGA